MGGDFLIAHDFSLWIYSSLGDVRLSPWSGDTQEDTRCVVDVPNGVTKNLEGHVLSLDKCWLVA